MPDLLIGGNDFGQKFFICDVQHPCQIDLFDVCDKTLPRFHALDGVLVQIESDELECICQLPLGFAAAFAVMGDLCAAYVISSVGSLVGEHGNPPQ